MAGKKVAKRRLRDLDIREISLVQNPAVPAARFLLMKSADGDVKKREMDTASINDLPDSAFAYIEPGGEKEDGKTKPRSLRHYPVHDEAHVRNALARASQQISAGGKGAEIARHALPKIKAAARKFGIDVSDEEKSVTKEEQEGDPAPVVAAAQYDAKLEKLELAVDKLTKSLEQVLERLEKSAVPATPIQSNGTTARERLLKELELKTADLYSFHRKLTGKV